MARKLKRRPRINVERLEGRELTTSLAGVNSGPVGVQPPQVEIRKVPGVQAQDLDAGSNAKAQIEVRKVGQVTPVSIHAYHGAVGFFVS